MFASATADAHPTGRVVDATGAPIRGAHVNSAITDVDGRYTLDAPIGTDLVVLADHFGAGLGTVTGEQIADIVLYAEETISISGEGPAAAQGSARLGRKDLERIPGAGNDILKSLQAMPGVASYPLPIGASGVVIRGSSPQDSKLLIDDFEVPSLYHDLGFRSVIPAEAIDSLEYVPGGFDVSQGRAASGIVALTTRAGGETSQQAELSAGDASVLAQGPGYMIAFRRSTIDLLLPSLLPDDVDLSLTTVPRYYDEQVRFDYELGEKWNVRFSSLGSDDAMELYASRDRNPDKRYLNRTRFLRAIAAARYHDGPWTANLALSGIAVENVFERGLYQHLDVTAPALTARAEVMRTHDDVAVRLGAETVVTDHHLDLAMPMERREGEPQSSDDPMDASKTYVGTIRSTNLAAWSSLAANLDPRIRVTGGVRVDSFTRVHETLVQPRGELAIKLTPHLTTRFSAGSYSRPPEYQTELLTPSLKAERSRQLIAGVTYEPAQGVRLQSSVYYTDRTHLITRDASMTLGNQGRGTTVGAEVLATAKRGALFAWLAYSFSHSTRVDEPGAPSRLFDYDQPHSLNAAASYEFRKITVGARFRLSSGLPATPVESAIFDSDANSYDPLYGDINSQRAPIHHQLDVRIDRRWTWGPVKMSNFLDVQNVYMNNSVVGYFYGFDYTQRAAFRSLPILPTAGVRGEF